MSIRPWRSPRGRVAGAVFGPAGRVFRLAALEYEGRAEPTSAVSIPHSAGVGIGLRMLSSAIGVMPPAECQYPRGRCKVASLFQRPPGYGSQIERYRAACGLMRHHRSTPGRGQYPAVPDLTPHLLRPFERRLMLSAIGLAVAFIGTWPALAVMSDRSRRSQAWHLPRPGPAAGPGARAGGGGSLQSASTAEIFGAPRHAASTPSARSGCGLDSHKAAEADRAVNWRAADAKILRRGPVDDPVVMLGGLSCGRKPALPYRRLSAMGAGVAHLHNATCRGRHIRPPVYWSAALIDSNATDRR